MLPKSQRIPRDLFSLFKATKHSFLNDLFTLKVVENKDNKQSRFCFSVSKKISKKAVVRNSLRRLGYRVLSGIIPELQTGLLYCFYYRKIPKSINHVEIEMSDILKKSRLYKS